MSGKSGSGGSSNSGGGSKSGGGAVVELTDANFDNLVSFNLLYYVCRWEIEFRGNNTYYTETEDSTSFSFNN